MNRKQLSILIVLVIVLGGAGLFLRQKQSASWREGSPGLGKKLLGEFPVNDVAQILIRQGTNQLNLAKKEGSWRVSERNDYPANYQEISDFLLKVREMKVIQSEEVGPSQLPRLALVEDQTTNSATAVEFKDQSGKTIRSMLLGKKHMRKSSGRPSPFGDMGDEGWPDGRYIKVGQDSRSVAVVSDALASIEPKPEQWISKDFVKVEKPKTISVTFPVETNCWSVARETESGEWKLQDPKPGEQLDVTKASSAANSLGSSSFSDVLVGKSPEQVGLDKPTVIAVTTFDGFSYTFKVGQKTNDNYPVTVSVSAQLPSERTPGKDEKAEDKDKLDKEFKEKTKKLEDKLAQEKACENWTFLASTWSFDSVLKDRHQLLVEKKDETKKDDKTATGATSSTTEAKDSAGADDQDADTDSSTDSDDDSK